jgi:hypothetical protein
VFVSFQAVVRTSEAAVEAAEVAEATMTTPAEAGAAVAAGVSVTKAADTVVAFRAVAVVVGVSETANVVVTVIIAVVGQADRVHVPAAALFPAFLSATIPGTSCKNVAIIRHPLKS